MQKLTTLVFLLVAAALCLDPAAAQTGIDSLRPPIIDMHLHAYRLDDGEPPAVNPVTGRPSAARTSAELRDMSLAELERYNIVKAVASGPPETVGQWREVAPDRIMVGAWVDEASPLPDLARLRAEMQAGRVHVLGELILQHERHGAERPSHGAVLRSRRGDGHPGRDPHGDWPPGNAVRPVLPELPCDARKPDPR